MAYGSRGTELRGLALLDIAPFYTNTTQGRYVAWRGTMEHGMFNASGREEQIARTTGTKVNAWGVVRLIVRIVGVEFRI